MRPVVERWQRGPLSTGDSDNKRKGVRGSFSITFRERNCNRAGFPTAAGAVNDLITWAHVCAGPFIIILFGLIYLTLDFSLFSPFIMPTTTIGPLVASFVSIVQLYRQVKLSGPFVLRGLTGRVDERNLFGIFRAGHQKKSLLFSGARFVKHVSNGFVEVDARQNAQQR